MHKQTHTDVSEGQQSQSNLGVSTLDPEGVHSAQQDYEQVVPDKSARMPSPESSPYMRERAENSTDGEEKVRASWQNSLAVQKTTTGLHDIQERQQMDRRKARPLSAIFTSPGDESLPKAKIFDNSKRNSIAVSSPRRLPSSFSQDLKKNASGPEGNRNANSSGGLERRAQTVSARLSYLAQPKRVNEPVKTSRSETMPTTIPIAPRTTPLVKPAQTALVKARSIRARTKTDEKPAAKAVVAPTPTYVQNAKSKIDWESIKRERRATQIESTSFEFVAFDDKDHDEKHEDKEGKVEDNEEA
ncbi:hypothetical protein VKS41_008139 [Umbelopsis sp. WA50703]